MRPTGKLTKAQRGVLELLRELHDRELPCYTTSSATYKSWDCGYAAGAVVRSLVTRGLARYTSGWQVGAPGSTRVKITAEGIEALILSTEASP